MTILKPHQTLLFIGDSITDCGRRDPQHRPLGSGYVRFFRDLQLIREPEKPVTILNRGISGNCVDNLRTRWNEDVLLHRPDFLSIKIGVNDLNHALSNPERAFLRPKGYREIYEQLLTLTRRELPGTGLLLISPFFISTDRNPDSYRAKVLNILPEYIAAVESLAQQFDARFLNLHAAFQERLKFHHPDTYCPEPAHPHPTGHLFMAEKVWEILQA